MPAGTIIIHVSPNTSENSAGTRQQGVDDVAQKRVSTLSRAFYAAKEARANGHAGPVMIVIDAGHYFLNDVLVINPDMCAGGLLEITAAAGAEVILDGSRAISGWKPCESPPQGTPEAATGKLWEADIEVGWFFAQLSVDATSLPRSATVLTDKWLDWPTGNLADDAQELIVEPDVLPANDRGRRAELNFLPTPYTRWSNAIAPVEEVVSEEGRIRFAPTLFHRPEVLKDIPFRLENLAAGLKAPGRWFVDDTVGKVYLWPPKGVDLKTALVTAPCLESLLHVSGDGDDPVRNVVIRGLRFSGAGLKRVIGKEPVSRFNCSSDAVTLQNVANTTLDSCTFHGLSGNALAAHGFVRNLSILRCTIFECGGAGISISGSLATPDPSCIDNEIADNVIYDCGKLYWHSNAISGGFSERSLIHHNYIHHMPYVAIGTSGVRHRWFANWPRPRPDLEEIWRKYGDGQAPTVESVKPLVPGHNRIENNLIHDVMQKLDDGAAIYCHAGKENLVMHNLVCRTHSDSSHGLYFDDEEYGSRMKNNIVVNCPMNHPAKRGSSLHVHNNARNIIDNNIFYGSNRLFTFPASYGGHRVEHNIFVFSHSAQYQSTPAPVTGSGDGRRQPEWNAGSSVMDHNLFWSADGGKAAQTFLETWRDQTGFEKQSAVADPGFTAPINGDFGITEGSPAIQVGFTPFPLADYGPRHLQLDAVKVLNSR